MPNYGRGWQSGRVNGLRVRNRDRLSEGGGGGRGGSAVQGKGWQSGRVNGLRVLGVGSRKGQVGPVPVHQVD